MAKEDILSTESFGELLKDIKSFAEESVEIVDQASNITPMLGVAMQIWNYQKERKMKRFLKGLAEKLNEKGGYDSEDREKLKNFLSNDHSKEKFFGILDEALNSVSEISSEILGYFAGDILLSTQKIDYSSSIIIHALRNMNDWDIEYISKAYNFLISLPKEQTINGVNSTALFLELPLEGLNEDIDKMILTDENLIAFKSSLMKLNNLQVINTGGNIWSTDANTFIRSKIGDKLNELVNMFLHIEEV